MGVWFRLERANSILHALEAIEPQPVPWAPVRSAAPPRLLGATCKECGRKDGNYGPKGRHAGFVIVGPDHLCVPCRTHLLEKS